MKFATKNKILVITCLLIFIFTLFLRIWRISEAPDVYGDEVTYNVISNNLLTTGNLTYDKQLWFVHPPLYYIFLAIYLSLSAQSGVTLDSIYLARTLSGILAGFMVIAVFLFVVKIYNLRCAILTSVVLAIDPYLIKFSRIGVIESAALMFIVVTIYLFYRAETSTLFKHYRFAGIFLGLVLLTKEFAGYIMLAFMMYVIVSNHLLKTKINIRGLSAFFGMATVVYMIYFVWGWHAETNTFFSSKFYLIKRMTGFVIDTGYLTNRYNSFSTDFLETLWIYGTTHMLVFISIPSSIYLLLKERKKEIILLVSWLFTSFAFLGIIRIRNPQFYCYIIVPAIILDGIMLSLIIKNIHFTLSRNIINIRSIVGLTVLLLLIGYNGFVWNIMYNVGTDTAYVQSIRYIRSNISEKEKIFIVPTSEYLLPGYQTYFGHQTVGDLRTMEINYFVISPRLYYMMSGDTLDYILKNGRLVASFDGHSSRKVDIYYIRWS